MEPQLLELPVELLLSILNLLSASDLTTICLVSRCLNRCAISVYFKRCGVRADSDLSVIELLELRPSHTSWLYSSQPQPLRAVRLSAFTTTIKHFRCLFTFPEYWLVWQVRSVYRILQKVEHAEEFTMDFTELPECLKDPSSVERMKPLDEWHRAFAMLIDLALKKGCKNLRIIGGNFMSGTRAVKFLEQSAMPKTNIRLSLKSIFKTGPSPPRSPSPPPLDIPLSELHSLFAAASNAINSSNLSGLVIHSLDLPSRKLSSLLGSIELPRLEKLEISVPYVSFGDLAPFLERHPVITHLRIGWLSPRWDSGVQKMQLLSKLLPHLQNIHIPVLMLRRRLMYMPDSFPQLDFLGLQVHLTSRFDFRDFCTQLPTMTKRLGCQPRALEICIQTPDWLELPDSGGVQDPDDEDPFRLVEHIAFVGGSFSFHETERQLLPRWLSRFSSLLSVDILCPAAWSGCHRQKQALARALPAQCPSLKSLGINGEAVNYQGSDIPVCLCNICKTALSL